MFCVGVDGGWDGGGEGEKRGEGGELSCVLQDA